MCIETIHAVTVICPISSGPEVPGRIVSKHQLHEERARHDGEPGDSDGTVSFSSVLFLYEILTRLLVMF